MHFKFVKYAMLKEKTEQHLLCSALVVMFSDINVPLLVLNILRVQSSKDIRLAHVICASLGVSQMCH